MSKNSAYPLIKELGLGVRTLWGKEPGDLVSTVYVDADDLERVLEQGVRVYGSTQSLQDGSFHIPFDNKQTDDDVQTALLIGIEPIQKDTAESLLREILVSYENAPWAYRNDYLIERAKRLLEQK